MKSSDLHKQLTALHEKRDELELEIYKVKRQLQNICDHDWEWHPIAYPIAEENRYCTKCQKQDYSED